MRGNNRQMSGADSSERGVNSHFLKAINSINSNHKTKKDQRKNVKKLKFKSGEIERFRLVKKRYGCSPNEKKIKN